MDGESSIQVKIPLDSDGFLRRECQSCAQQFKWFNRPADPADEPAVQYFCPLCGTAAPANTNSWWTSEQRENVLATAKPEIVRMLKGDSSSIGGLPFEPSETATANVLVEPNDMVVVQPPCHSNEPTKVPDGSTERVYCLICGTEYSG